MPGRRVYHKVLAAGHELTAAQRQRFLRDAYYRTGHSVPGEVFVELDQASAGDAKSTLRGKILHWELDRLHGWTEPFGRKPPMLL
jgi:hypothetical protein